MITYALSVVQTTLAHTTYLFLLAIVTQWRQAAHLPSVVLLFSQPLELFHSGMAFIQKASY
jgi:hypothetical protein